MPDGVHVVRTLGGVPGADGTLDDEAWLALWLPEDRDIFVAVARDAGWAYVRAHVLLILDQARAIGELDPEQKPP